MAYTEAEMDKMLADTRATLMQLPGVVGVGFGKRERNGRAENELCWCVYVRDKRKPEDLPEDQRIPPFLNGYPTDVTKMRNFKSTALSCTDVQIHSVLKSGHCISTMIPTATGGYPTGTLGFFGKRKSEANNEKNVVAITNHHVLAPNGAKAGDTVYQPKRRINNGVFEVFAPSEEHKSISFGVIKDLGKMGDIRFTPSGGSEDDYFVDAASVHVEFCISSWCGTHCGAEFMPEGYNMNVNGGSTLDGYEELTPAMVAAVTDYEVFKVGFKTSQTKGRIHRINVPGTIGGVAGSNIIEVEVIGVNCDGDAMFGIQGDSGSVVVNKDRKVIGLLCGEDSSICAVCHIGPVLQLLDIEPITTANPHPYMETLRQDRAHLEGNAHLGLAEMVRSDKQGARYISIFEAHRMEVSGLINRCRPVTVAWRRHQGPAFTNRVMANSRNPEVLIPEVIEGVTLLQLAEVMLPLLRQHGSPALQAAIDAHAGTLLEHLPGLRSLHTLVESLSQAPYA